MLRRESRSYNQRQPGHRRSHGESQPTTHTTSENWIDSMLQLYRTPRLQGCIFYHVPTMRGSIRFTNLASSKQASTPKSSHFPLTNSRQSKERNVSIAAEKPKPSMLMGKRKPRSSFKTTSVASLRRRWRRDGLPHPLKELNSRALLQIQTICSRSRSSHSSGNPFTQTPSREQRRQQMHSKANKPRLFE